MDLGTDIMIGAGPNHRSNFTRKPTPRTMPRIKFEVTGKVQGIYPAPSIILIERRILPCSYSQKGHVSGRDGMGSQYKD